MQDYRWRGISAKGASVRGVTRASSGEDLKDKLLKKEIALLSQRKIHKKPPTIDKITKILKTPLKHYVSFFHDLSLMLDAGMALTEALNFTKSCTPSKKFKKVIGKLIIQVNEGSQLSYAIEKENKSFSTLMVQIVRSGEESGNLSESLKHLERYLTSKLNLQQKLKQAALMPIVTIGFALCIMGGMYFYVMPQFEPFMGAANNDLTLLSNSEYYRALVIMGLIIVFLFMQFTKLVRKIIVLNNFANFVRTLSLLIKSGNSVNTAIISASNVCTNRAIKKEIQRAAAGLNQGKSLQEVFRSISSAYTPTLLASAVSVGEKTGKLEVMLEKSGILLEKQLLDKISLFVTIFQPALIVCTGVVIAYLLISLYMPIIDLSRAFS